VRKLAISLLTIAILICSAQAQTRRDPRGMAMACAYGVVARGLFTINYNPANLAIPHEYDSYRIWGAVATSFTNSFLSLNNYTKYNGKNLEADDGELKQDFLSEIPDEGWRIYTDLHLPLPYINSSHDNKAFTSDFIVIGDLGMPKGLVQFLFNGNPIGQKLDLKFREEFLMLNQWAYSFAIPVRDIFMGFSFKYLQGISYLGVNPDSSYGSVNTYFEQDRCYIVGGGRYLFQQSVGGRGFALDFGITSKEINGYRLGISITNLFGRIVWNKKTLTSRLLGGKGFFLGGEHFVYEFQVNEARFDKFFGKYKFRDVFPGKGRSFSDSTEFVMRYPALLRFSLSKWLDDGILYATDFVVGFEDRLYSFGTWKWANGIEFTRSPRFPLRVGVSFGGWKHRELTFGSGFNLAFIHIDWALGLNHGLWFTTTKGVNFAICAYTTGKNKDFKKEE